MRARFERDFIQIKTPFLHDGARVASDFIERQTVFGHAQRGFTREALFAKPHIAAIKAQPVQTMIGDLTGQRRRGYGRLALRSEGGFNIGDQLLRRLRSR
jgi:hypothetical protein